MSKTFLCNRCYVVGCFFILITLSHVFAETNPISLPSPSQSTTEFKSDSILWSLPDPNTMEWETYWQTLRDKLVAKAFTLDAWKKQTADYFQNTSFSPQHIQLWDTIIRQTPELQSDILMYGEIFTLEALLKEVQKQTPSISALHLASQFLLRNIDNLKETQIIQLSDIIDAELKKNPVSLEQIWSHLLQQISTTEEVPPTPHILAPLYEAMINFCMTLTSYLPPNKFSSLVQLPEPMKGFFNDFNILVFDGGILTEPHYHSLRSIFSCFPPKLHNIRILIFPEQIGISATQLFIPLQYGVILDLPFLPLDVMSNPEEFPSRYGSQIAPEFSMQVAVQIIRAIQFTQFRLRPELLLRRNSLLLNARARNYNYTRPTVHPEIYFANPDELLPLSSYLWILNSEKVLQMANDLLKIRQHFATDVYLLLADMLSAGGNSTLTFFMDETGYLTVREAPVVRAPIDEGYPAVITILPERYPPSFEIKKGTSGNGLYPVNPINPITHQENTFSSAFPLSISSPPENNASKGKIYIETKGN